MAYKAGSVYIDAELRDNKFKRGMGGLKTAAITGAAAIAAAIVAGMVKSVKAAEEFEKAMSNVATVIDTSVISTSSLTNQLLKLDPALGDTTDLTKGLYQAFSAGAKDADQAMQITTDSAMFAKAALTDTATAVDVLTTAVNAYGDDVYTSTEASDIFFTTIKEGKITGEELASTIGQSIPLFSSMGLSLEELSSGLATMTKQGISSSEATTQLNAIVNAFIKPSQDMTDALLDAGYASGSAMLEAEGLSGALEFLEDATGGSKEEIAKLVPNIRGMRGVMALTGKGGKIFAETMDAMGDSVGATKKAFDKQEKTWNTFRNSLGKTEIIIGKIGKAFLDEIAEGATTALEKVNQFLLTGEAAEMFGNVIGYVAASFTALKEIVTPLIDVTFDSFKEISESMSEAMEKLGGKSDVAASSFNALGYISNTVTAYFGILLKGVSTSIGVFADFILSIKDTGKAVGTLIGLLTGKSTWDDVKEQFKTVGEDFATAGKDYIGIFVDMFNEGKERLSTFSEDSKEIATNISTNVSSSFDNTKNFVSGVWDTMLDDQETYHEEAAEITTESNDELIEETEETSEEVVTTWQGAWEQLKAGNSDAYDSMISNLQDKMDVMSDVFSDSFGAFLDTQKIFLENKENDLNEAWDKEKETLDTQYQGIIDKQKEINKTKQDLEKEHNDKMRDLDKKLRSDLTEQEKKQIQLEKDQEEKAYQDQLDALNDNLMAVGEEKEQHEEAMQKAEEDHAKELDALKKKQFEADKASRISQVWIDAASSIMGWWATAPQLGIIAGPIVAGIMTGVTTGAAIAQTVAISQQRYTPSFAGGGTMVGDGFAQINEQGGEIQKLKDGTIIIPNDISRDIAAASGNVINVSFAGANINNDMDLDYIVDRVSESLAQQLRAV